jgi:Dr1-associated corepressor
MSGRGKRQPVAKVENNGGGSALGPSQGIEVRTKFPVARIKRIMQADEEVGKVAQVTPVAVCKFFHLLSKCNATLIPHILLPYTLKRRVYPLTALSTLAKALELFMISLVTKSADVAKEANSKRVTAQHLKKAIAADEQFDFLNDIVSRVAEGPDAGGKRIKDDDDSDEEDKKAVKKTKGRRKKGD